MTHQNLVVLRNHLGNQSDSRTKPSRRRKLESLETLSLREEEEDEDEEDSVLVLTIRDLHRQMASLVN
ncbi:hypothetical protein GGP41_003891 [Bipolaris sorokiniana]|uniref:Uncharacterized protein n=1 Tax=Cochliobolus sativus TaxID=45130 RepID=A0A8H6DSK0_COCSA|nr:hypothetical protein GGP41_003891 [Bipolaris sorokiniana]